MPAPAALAAARGRLPSRSAASRCPPTGSDQEVSVDFQAARNALWLEIPDAANLNAGDNRTHGIHLLAADLRLADGREFLSV